MTSLEEAKRIAEVLDSKKAQEVKVLKVADLTFVAEYFVLATGHLPYLRARRPQSLQPRAPLGGR